MSCAGVAASAAHEGTGPVLRGLAMSRSALRKYRSQRSCALSASVDVAVNATVCDLMKPTFEMLLPAVLGKDHLVKRGQLLDISASWRRGVHFSWGKRDLTPREKSTHRPTAWNTPHPMWENDVLSFLHSTCYVPFKGTMEDLVPSPQGCFWQDARS